MEKNKKVWLENCWFKGWNPKNTAFCIQSPWNTNGLIWFYKSYFLESKYKGWFGVEINIINYLTNQPHNYQEVVYNLSTKKINEVSGEKLYKYFENLKNEHSENYRDFVKKLVGEKVYD